MPAPAYYAHIAAYRARQIYFAAQAIQKRRMSKVSTSLARASTNNSTSADTMNIPNIHENHRLKMFFI